MSANTENPGVTPTILIDFGPSTTIAGPVSDGSVGNTGLEIAGNVTLSGTNTFTGGVTLPSAGMTVSPDGTATSAGYVTFASAGALPAYSQLTVNAGATAVAANHGSGTYNWITWTAGEYFPVFSMIFAPRYPSIYQTTRQQ